MGQPVNGPTVEYSLKSVSYAGSGYAYARAIVLHGNCRGTKLAEERPNMGASQPTPPGAQEKWQGTAAGGRLRVIAKS